MANLANVAATLMEHLCEHGFHGYTQGGGRWGDGEGVCEVEVEGKVYAVEQGDRDCSSAVIDCWRQALKGTPYEGKLDAATYTGDMRRVFTASGLFEWRPMSFIAQRGDVYLNERDHTAMCTSAVPDMLAEFWLNEFGGIVGGAVGDQGSEARLRAYYDFPWDGILHYNGKADESEEPMADIGEEVWGREINGVRADELLAILGSTDDPTGRGVEMNTHDHVKWIAKKLADVDAKLDALLAQK